jgi:hypothetical protein
MTVKEAILAQLGFAPGNQNVIDLAIADNELTGQDTYVSVEHMTSVKSAALQVLRILLSTADTTTSTGGVTTQSIKYDRGAILKRIGELEVDLGLVDERPTINARYVW